MRLIGFALLLTITSSQAFADVIPPKIYWSCVTNLEKVSGTDMDLIKERVMRDAPKGQRLEKYVAALSEASIKGCSRERLAALTWRSAHKSETPLQAEIVIQKIDDLAPEMIKINLGQTILTQVP